MSTEMLSTQNENQKPSKLTKKDFETEQDVRWCPGCGDYSILAAVQRLLPTLGIPIEKYVFVSGIGCSSRFPYYMNTYGFHTVHGRAPAVATGVKMGNEDLSVWVVTGDGDALSIGGNHIIHLLRRNVDMNVLLFNNKIYGLTKGQYSPTSEEGKVTKSTPMGSLDYPINPIRLALASEGTFIARTLDVDPKHMTEVFRQAAAHKGTSFVEVYQNCNIFNDGAFKYMSERDVRADSQLQLENKELLIFGKKRDKGIAIENFQPKVVEFEADNQQAAEDAGVLRYDNENVQLANIIAGLNHPEFPVPMGVFLKKQRATFNELSSTQLGQAVTKSPPKESVDDNLQDLFSSGDTWLVN